MSATRDAISTAMKEAMKARDSAALSTLRLMLAKLKDKDIESRTETNRAGIDEAAELSVLAGMIKQRRESIALYHQGGRQDLVDSETAEIAVIERFLPRQMSEDEARAAIASLVAEIQAGSIKDMGRTMAVLKERFAGRMDFTRASALVKETLTKAG